MGPDGKYAQFGLRLPYPYPEKPVKSSVSVHGETGALLYPICQNTAGLHLIKIPSKALKSRLFLPLILSHPDPERLSEREYEGRFFLRYLEKCDLNRYREVIHIHYNLLLRPTAGRNAVRPPD
jgi:hypothetical protein